MSPQNIAYIVGILVCLFFSAFFSASETAFTSFNKSRMKMLANDGNKTAALCLKMEANYSKLLSTILVGNNIVNIAASSMGTLLFIDLMKNTSFASAAATVSTAVLTVLVLIFGEISPKNIAKDHALGFAMGVCRFLYVLEILLTPVNWLFMLWKKLLNVIFKSKGEEAVTEDEVLMMVDEAHEDGSIDTYDKEIIENVFDFDDTTAMNAATHRRDLTMLYEEDSIEDWENTVLNSRFSRYPICREDADEIVGILDARAFLKHCEDGREAVMKYAVRPPYFVPESVKLDVLFKNMKGAHESFAVVLDEYGGTSGVVTMTDIIECIVGDFSESVNSEEEPDPEFEQLEENTWVVRGDVLISDVNRKTGANIDDDDVSTLSGYILGVKGEIPAEGASFEIETEELTIKVLTIKDMTVERAELTVKKRDDEEQADEPLSDEE